MLYEFSFLHASRHPESISRRETANDINASISLSLLSTRETSFPLSSSPFSLPSLDVAIRLNARHHRPRRHSWLPVCSRLIPFSPSLTLSHPPRPLSCLPSKEQPEGGPPVKGVEGEDPGWPDCERRGGARLIFGMLIYPNREKQQSRKNSLSRFDWRPVPMGNDASRVCHGVHMHSRSIAIGKSLIPAAVDARTCPERRDGWQPSRSTGQPLRVANDGLPTNL